ncbi:MAG TPA: histidine kinase, partial [Cyclobacteriaceae bacterium]|nr:histidine kinase [Cyclobacteriaceae bacterium]
MVNRKRLYWTLQITGWVTYVLLQIVWFSFSTENEIPVRRVLFFIVEGVICLAVTHVFRNYVNRFRWVDLSVPKMLMRVLPAIFVLSIVIFFL